MEYTRLGDRLSTAEPQRAGAARSMTRADRDIEHMKDLKRVIDKCEYDNFSPKSWLDVLREDLLASRVAHVPHDAGSFMSLARETYKTLPIRYSRMLHSIIWEQTKLYVIGGTRQLRGLSHPMSPQGHVWQGEFFE